MSTLVVVWRVTERCDLGCGFCAFDRSLPRARRDACQTQVARFGPVLARLQRDTGVRVLVSWLGGEPLLWAGFAAMSREYHARHGLALSTTTNGTRLGRTEVRACLLRHFTELTLSVDGFAAHHDALRGRAGLFEALRDSVTQLARDKQTSGGRLLLRANVVLMRGTVDAFLPLCRELARWGIEEITFNQLGGNDRHEFHAAHRLLPGEADRLAEALPRWRAELAALGVRLRGSRAYLGRIAASSRDESIAPACCDPGRGFLFIDAHGRVSPCCFTSNDYAVPLEELDSADAILLLPARFAERRHGRPARACANCLSTQFFGKFASLTGAQPGWVGVAAPAAPRSDAGSFEERPGT